jgi:hypothetical protein
MQALRVLVLPGATMKSKPPSHITPDKLRAWYALKWFNVRFGSEGIDLSGMHAYDRWMAYHDADRVFDCDARCTVQRCKYLWLLDTLVTLMMVEPNYMFCRGVGWRSGELSAVGLELLQYLGDGPYLRRSLWTWLHSLGRRRLYVAVPQIARAVNQARE